MQSSIDTSPAPAAVTPARAGGHRHLPGEPGMWLFIFGDMCVFTIMFAVFLVMRSGNPTVFESAEHHLGIGYGAVMTLLLLISSLFVVRGVQSVRMSIAADRSFRIALLCGVGFVVLKGLEWGSHIAAGQTLITNHFWNFYYVLTGVHLMHVIIGMGLLFYVLRESRNPVAALQRFGYVEGAACFWHMVDLLWIVIFPLLYLLR